MRDENKHDVASVILSMGRHHLKVAGFILATEGDACRDGGLPEAVLPAIPDEELEHASIGGKPAKDMPIEMVRWFRGDQWNGPMMKYVADEINRKCRPAELPADSRPPRD